MPWTTEQKTFIIEAYFRLDSIRSAQTQFKKHFQCRVHPTHRLIYCWVNKFRDHGTVNNLNSKDSNRISHSGRPMSITTPQNVNAVRDSVVRSPSKSLRRRSQELEIPRELVRRILLKDLHLYPYRIQININLLLMTCSQSDTKRGVCESDRELCTPDSSLPSAQGCPSGTCFVISSQTNTF